MENKKGGVKYDQDKPMMALIPSEAEFEEAAVWTFGAEKYGKWNWTKGIDFTRIISAAQRHLSAIKAGEDVDPESNKLHAAHVRCCMGMLIYFTLNDFNHLDDRVSKMDVKSIDSLSKSDIVSLLNK